MEPTMDKRMTKFALMVANSKAKPKNTFRLQTNGTLLHIHNIDDLRTAEINKITVSIDTIDPEIHKEMRGGSDLNKILKNIKDLKNEWPESKVQFITTVNSRNLSKLDDLCEYALDNQICFMELRKMFYNPESNVIKDHDKMKSIFLSDDEFDKKTMELVEKYKNRMKFYVNDSKQLEKHRSAVKT
jgi:MoaA/NifB/PqqE/SkfB family radical SAM enzyme